jgi:zinc protease
MANEEDKTKRERKTLSEKLPEGITFVTEEDGIGEYKMTNGMKIVLLENRVAPVATFMVIYRVGSRNEAVGYTGSTHLLEHLMFKGTPTFNKNNNTQIAASLQRIGASFNATTWYDRTNYFETVPSDQLELAIKLEADRMRNSFIADEDRQSEMTVVRNELERGQNEPSNVLDEAVYATAFREHPYHHPTIGWRSDVEGVPTSRLKEFYDTFYHPNNATAIVVGDFEKTNALELINKYFGHYAASERAIPEVYTDEPEQEGERRLIIRRTGELALVQIGFRTPAALGQMNVLSNTALAERAANPPAENDIYPLVVLSIALSSGITSRLYQVLVETQLAVGAYTNADQHRDPGLFCIYATVAPDVEPKKVEEIILNELKKVADEGLSESEIEKAKQQIIANEAFSRDGTHRIASQLSEAEAVADWRFYKDYTKNIQKVKVEDTKRVAQKYFTEDNRTVGYFIPRQRPHIAPPHLDVAHPISLYESKQNHRAVAQSHHPSVCYYRDPLGIDENIPHTSPLPHSSSAFASRVVRHQTENGAVLLALENKATPTLALRGSIRAGSYFEPLEKPGLASIVAEMMERGTQKRTKLQMANDLESVGADINFSSDAFSVNVSGRALSKDLQLIITAVSECLREPLFSTEELEKLKQQVIASIQEQQQNTRYRAYERFTNLIYDSSHPYCATPGEDLIKSISSITIEDVRAFYEKQYDGRSMIMSVVGDIDAEELAKLFDDAFGSLSGDANVEIKNVAARDLSGIRHEVVQIKDKANVDVIMGHATDLMRGSADYYAATLANSALGESTLSSRLGLRVRDKEGLTYGINSSFRSPSLVAGPWYIGVSLNPQNVEKGINSALEVIRDYIENGIREDELADEKSSAIGSFKVGLGTNAGLARRIWTDEFYGLGIDYVDRYADIINNITIEEVNAAIKKYFRPDDLTIVMAGDYSAE